MVRRWSLALIVALLAAIGGLTPVAPAGASGWQISVNPSTGLHDGQSVSVTGSGFTERTSSDLPLRWLVTQCTDAVLGRPPDINVAVASCDISSTPPVFADPDAQGNVSVSYRVSTTFTPGFVSAPVDCTQTPCAVMVAQLADNGFFGAATAISFAPTVAARAVRIDGRGSFGVDHVRSFAIDGVQRTGADAPEGAFTFDAPTRKLAFVSTSIGSVDRLHNVARLLARGTVGGKDGYTAAVVVVDNGDGTIRPDRISVEIRDALDHLVFSSTGLRRLRSGDVEIGTPTAT